MAEKVKQSILIVEDDQALMDLYKSKFESDGFVVHAASTGEDALKTLSDNNVDLILLDIMLPDLSGFDLLGKLKDTKSVPIIVLTVLPESIARKRSVEMGADDFLVKSQNTPDSVLNYVKTLIHTSESHKSD